MHFICSEGLLTHLFSWVREIGWGPSPFGTLAVSSSLLGTHLGKHWQKSSKNVKKDNIMSKNTLGWQKLDFKKPPEATPWPSKGALKKKLVPSQKSWRHPKHIPFGPPPGPTKIPKTFLGINRVAIQPFHIFPHAKRCRISARFFLEGSRGLENSIKKGPRAP